MPFFGATFLWSWLWWWPITSLPADAELADMPAWMMGCLLLGAYGPSIVGVVLTWRAGGRTEVVRLLKSLITLRVGWRWSALALSVPWLMMLVGVLLLPLTEHSLGPANWSRLALVPVAILAAIPFGPLGEELGWRGFALPRLVERYGAVMASLMIGLVWTLWHVPLFWAPAGSTISGGPINVVTVGTYAATLVAMSFLATWLLWRAGAFVSLAVLVHVGFNVDLPLIPFRETAEAADRTVMMLAAVGAVALSAWLAMRLRGVRELSPAPRA